MSKLNHNKIIIIGAGLTGLCTGCYLQMKGFSTEIYELHNLPGGLCTSWHRKGYTFDGCIHWLVGSGPGDNFNNLWNELIDMKKVKFVDFDYYLKAEDLKGNSFKLFADVDKLEEELLRFSPEDKIPIKEFCKSAKKFSKLNMPIEKAPELYNILDGLKIMFKMLPYSFLFSKWRKLSQNEFASRFKNPLLRLAFSMSEFEDMGATFNLFRQSWMHKKSAGYPIGGSLEFSRLFEKKYYELGGKVFYNCKVEKINVENHKATGIKLKTGEEINGDLVVSAADGFSTIYKMLEGKYVGKEQEKWYSTGITFPSLVQVSFGINKDFSSEPHSVIYPVSKPIKLDSKSVYNHILLRIFNFDATMSPPGKTVMYAFFATPEYKYWTDLRKNNLTLYRTEKNRIAGEVLEAVEERFGKLNPYVEEIDVATPATIIRYTNNWKGSYEGWLFVKGLGFINLKRTLPGLENFYMAGQWIEVGGGLPGCILSARNLSQIIEKKFKN